VALQRQLKSYGPWVIGAATSLVFAAIYAGFLEVTNRIVFAGVSNTLPEYGELFVFVFLIALGINAIMILLAPQVVTSED
jgi:TRAP-type mannitol/chloroaromatic compound transport system permease small subunit